MDKSATSALMCRQNMSLHESGAPRAEPWINQLEMPVIITRISERGAKALVSVNSNPLGKTKFFRMN